MLIDGDPQGNATSGVGAPSDQVAATVYDVLLGDRPISDATIRSVHFQHLDVVPQHRGDPVRLPHMLLTAMRRPFRIQGHELFATVSVGLRWLESDLLTGDVPELAPWLASLVTPRHRVPPGVPG